MKSVAAAQAHTCAITAADGLKCWGSNYYGNLGNGSAIDQSAPIDVPGLTSGVLAVAAGYNHTCVLVTGGAVKCWGENLGGQLGTGDTVDRPTPTSVAGLSGVPISLAVAGRLSCVLYAAGSVQCWGSGPVGDGTSVSRLFPTTVASLAGPVTQITVGFGFACGLLVNQTVQCWGRNGNGQLGDGTTATRLQPTTVPGLTGVAAVDAGSNTMCARLVGGALKCWGYSGSGMVGHGEEAAAVTSPQAVVGFSTGAQSVAVGSAFACALTTGGNVRCWGDNNDGELGLGYTGVHLTPTPVTGISGGTIALSAGGSHACALDNAGALRCWGSRAFGQVGDGQTTRKPQRTPVLTTAFTDTAAQISLGGSSTCAVTVGGGVTCWGYNATGQLGDGTTTSRSTPANVPSLSTGVRTLAAGHDHYCAITTDGAAKCWGMNYWGQLGNNPVDRYIETTPVAVSGLNSGVSSMSGAYNHTCAVLSTGAVKCWGSNYDGLLGDGTTTDRYVPTDVVGLSSGAASVATGGYATCALMIVETIKCWGSNAVGSLGDGGALAGSLTPVDTVPLGAPVTKLVMGSGHACALLNTGSVKCWGDNSSAALGDGTLINRTTPVTPVGLSGGVADISARGGFTCALMISGSIRCWGSNAAAQMGDGTVGYETTATLYVKAVGLSQPLAASDSPTVTAAVDGTMIVRFLAGLSGVGILAGIDTSNALRTDNSEVVRYLETIRPLLDIDGNTEFNPMTDGLLLIRYLLGVRGDTLVSSAVGNGATRSRAQIEAYLASLLP